MPAPALMILAAGLGTRMGALTADRPKPLIPVAGRPLIDHALAIATEAKAHPVVVNLHYKGEMLARHLVGRNVVLSWEREQLLETGGGLRAALPLLGSGPVALLNSDAVWTGPNPITALAAAWDPKRMDGLLALLPADRATGFALPGDFLANDDGRLVRAEGRRGMAYLGAQILKTDDLAAIETPAFSLNLVWDRMIARNRLYGMIHQGGWCDVGTPSTLKLAEEMLARERVGRA